MYVIVPCRSSSYLNCTYDLLYHITLAAIDNFGYFLLNSVRLAPRHCRHCRGDSCFQCVHFHQYRHYCQLFRCLQFQVQLSLTLLPSHRVTGATATAATSCAAAALVVVVLADEARYRQYLCQERPIVPIF